METTVTKNNEKETNNKLINQIRDMYAIAKDKDERKELHDNMHTVAYAYAAQIDLPSEMEHIRYDSEPCYVAQDLEQARSNAERKFQDGTDAMKEVDHFCKKYGLKPLYDVESQGAWHAMDGFAHRAYDAASQYLNLENIKETSRERTGSSYDRLTNMYNKMNEEQDQLDGTTDNPDYPG